MASDVESIDAIITATYDVISGPAGKKRDWDRMRSLFFPGSRLIPTAKEAGRDDVAGPSEDGQLLQTSGKPATKAPTRSSWATQPVGSTGCPAGAKRVDLAPNILDVNGFIARAEPILEKDGFYETEIARRVEHFGHLAHVWSTYESRRDPSDAQPFMRGINSIQLFHDGIRWWIVTIYWQHESSVDPVPAKYLKSN